MAMTLAEYVRTQDEINAPYQAAWLAWYESLSLEQRAEYHTGNDLGAEPRPPEPVRSYRAALIREIMSCQ